MNEDGDVPMDVFQKELMSTLNNSTIKFPAYDSQAVGNSTTGSFWNAPSSAQFTPSDRDRLRALLQQFKQDSLASRSTLQYEAALLQEEIGRALEEGDLIALPGGKHGTIVSLDALQATVARVHALIGRLQPVIDLMQKGVSTL